MQQAETLTMVNPLGKFPIPDEALAQHAAVLGKTGSGKTSTAKTIVEHLVAQGARVCILDPIKSDWWGLTSSVDGKRAGLPFHILGGPRGHVPLHAASGKAIAEIVANGTLPLSIIDMADFQPGGQSKFFIDFAPMLLRRMRGVVHLVMEEAHLFAPKERSGVGDENMAIHWAKMLATAGRSKGVRLILVTQRTQALHNALLGSCETMVAHRLTAPADQKPLIDWLKANTAKDVVDKVSGSLASLKTGTAWVCSGEAKFFELVTFPRIKTYDNSATPAAGDMGRDEVRTAPVDVERLRAIVGDAAKEAEANDPKALKSALAASQAELAKLRKAPAASPPAGKRDAADIKVQVQALTAARAEGFAAGYADGDRDGFARGAGAALDQGFGAVRDALKAFVGVQFVPPKRLPSAPKVIPATTSDAPARLQPSPAPRVAGQAGGGDAMLSKPQAKILESLSWWAAMGHTRPTRVQVGIKARMKARGGHFKTRASELSGLGLVAYDGPDRMFLTPAGEQASPAPAIGETVLDSLRPLLSAPQGKILDAMLAGNTDRQDIAAHAAMDAAGGHFKTRLSELSSMGIVEYPDKASAALQGWVRE